MTYVQLNITGRKRDRRTRQLYRWCITVKASEARRRAAALRRMKHVSRVEQVEKDGDE